MSETVPMYDRIAISATLTGQDRADSIWEQFRERSRMTPNDCHDYIWEHVPWLLDERTRYRTELERIAACEPAHRARIAAVLAGGEVGE